MKKEYTNISDNLRKIRIGLDLSQREMADMLGIPRSRYATYEDRRAEPDLAIVNKIANFHGISIENLIK